MRLWLGLGVGALGVLVLLLSGMVSSLASAQQQTATDPAAVVGGFETARNRRDVDAALEFFADDAVVSQRSTTYTGKDEIRRFLGGGGLRSRFVSISDRSTVGDHVTWTERVGGQGPQLQTQTQNQALGGFEVSVEAIVQDGKIRSITYGSAAPATQPVVSLDGRSQVPAAFGLAAVAMLVLGVLLVASVPAQAGGAGSRLRGRLMQDLQGWSAARE